MLLLTEPYYNGRIALCSSIKHKIVEGDDELPENDDVVLSHIYNHEDISQRQLVEKTNLSLGSINICLHRLVSRGLIKIEKVSARQLRYVLTPKGIARCMTKAVNYVKHAYQQISSLQQSFSKTVRVYQVQGKKTYLLGSDDEIYTILVQAIAERSLDRVFYVADIKEIRDKTNAVVLVWEEQTEKACIKAGFVVHNLVAAINPADII